MMTSTPTSTRTTSTAAMTTTVVAMVDMPESAVAPDAAADKSSDRGVVVSVLMVVVEAAL